MKYPLSRFSRLSLMCTIFVASYQFIISETHSAREAIPSETKFQGKIVFRESLEIINATKEIVWAKPILDSLLTVLHFMNSTTMREAKFMR